MNLNKKPARDEQGHWLSGQSGNPGGRPKKKPITRIYEEILDDPETREEVKQKVLATIRSGDGAPLIALLREMADRIEGKPTQRVEVDAYRSRFDQMTNEELDVYARTGAWPVRFLGDGDANGT
jgi:hypothetical protein